MKIRNLVFGAICGIIFFSCSESGGGKEVEMDRFVTDLMGKMTIREKLGQLNLPSGGDLVTGSVMNSELSDMIRKEEIGGFFNVKGIKKIYDLQRLAVEGRSRVCIGTEHHHLGPHPARAAAPERSGHRGPLLGRAFRPAGAGCLPAGHCAEAVRV